MENSIAYIYNVLKMTWFPAGTHLAGTRQYAHYFTEILIYYPYNVLKMTWFPAGTHLAGTRQYAH
jgi:hypothetical protein